MQVSIYQVALIMKVEGKEWEGNMVRHSHLEFESVRTNSQNCADEPFSTLPELL